MLRCLQALAERCLSQSPHQPSPNSER